MAKLSVHTAQIGLFDELQNIRLKLLAYEAAKELLIRRQSKMAFVGELLTFIRERWPTQASLEKSGRVVADCRGPVGEHLKFVVEPELRATAVFLVTETTPTTEKIRELISGNVPVESPFV